MMDQPKLCKTPPPIAPRHAWTRSDVDVATVLGLDVKVAPVGVER